MITTGALYLGCERAALAKEINKRRGNGSINVENQIRLLRRSDFLDLYGVIKQTRAGEMFMCKILTVSKCDLVERARAP